MKIACISLFIFFVSCDSADSNTKTNQYTKVDTLKHKLLGQWGGLGEDSAVLEIKIDSIYYLQEKKSYPYKIVDNDLVIERNESKGILRNISVIEDTMTFNDEQGLTTKGYRFKTKK
jgi:hypothetical protein